jgi:hypothetical protein
MPRNRYFNFLFQFIIPDWHSKIDAALASIIVQQSCAAGACRPVSRLRVEVPVFA